MSWEEAFVVAALIGALPAILVFWDTLKANTTSISNDRHRHHNAHIGPQYVVSVPEFPVRERSEKPLPLIVIFRYV